MVFQTGTAPMFVASEEELLAALRLGGLADLQAKRDVTTIVRNAIRGARVTFYERLSAHAVATLLATPSVSAPTTAAQIGRLRAELLEVKIVRRSLMVLLPVLFMDGTRAEGTIWNEEGLTRHADPMSALLDRLDEEIDQDFGNLDDDEDTGSGDIHATSFGSEEAYPPQPGFTVRTQPNNPWLNRQDRGRSL